MRSAVYKGPGEIAIEQVPEPTLQDPTEAIVKITHTAICGSDLWFYRGQRDREPGSTVGHEPMGIVKEVGDDVRAVAPGDRVIAPFVMSCGECEYCRKGLQTSCVDGRSWGDDNMGAQGEYVRVSHANGTLVRVPERYADREATLESLLPLTDVMSTGHHAAKSAGVGPGDTCVVVGDGAVGLCGVLAARRLGAERILAVGHHSDRLAVAESFGATETIDGSEMDAVDRVTETTYGGANNVLECVGAATAMDTAIQICRPGGTIGYVGAPYGVADSGMDVHSMFADNIELRGGIAPVRAYMEELMADVFRGTLDPSPVFTETVNLDGVPEGYRMMDDREAIKVMVKV